MTPPERPALVLASASPRRARVLRALGLDPVVDPPGVEEDEREGETPSAHVERLARRKASRVAPRHPGRLVLAGDTVVVLDGRIVGKPRDASHAVETLVSLAGRRHSVLTGLALAVPETSRPGPTPAGGAGFRVLSRVDATEVRFRDFHRAVAEAYVATGEPLGKAGSYAIQGLGAALVDGVEGDYYTVVGLPVSGLLSLLEEAGHPYDFASVATAAPLQDPQPRDP